MANNDLKREQLEYYRQENQSNAVAGAFLIWVLTGVVGFFLDQGDWMFSWWGFWFIGLPYLALLIAGTLLGQQKELESGDNDAR